MLVIQYSTRQVRIMKPRKIIHTGNFQIVPRQSWRGIFLCLRSGYYIITSFCCYSRKIIRLDIHPKILFLFYSHTQKHRFSQKRRFSLFSPPQMPVFLKIRPNIVSKIRVFFGLYVWFFTQKRRFSCTEMQVFSNF